MPRRIDGELRPSYRSIGVNELVRFEPEASPSLRLRIWDRTDGALTERVITGDSAPSSVLALHWIVAGAEGLPTALRIADEQGLIVPTHYEARKAEAEAGRPGRRARVCSRERIGGGVTIPKVVERLDADVAPIGTPFQLGHCRHPIRVTGYGDCPFTFDFQKKRSSVSTT